MVSSGPLLPLFVMTAMKAFPRLFAAAFCFLALSASIFAVPSSTINYNPNAKIIQGDPGASASQTYSLTISSPPNATPAAPIEVPIGFSVLSAPPDNGSTAYALDFIWVSDASGTPIQPKVTFVGLPVTVHITVHVPYAELLRFPPGTQTGDFQWKIQPSWPSGSGVVIDAGALVNAVLAVSVPAGVPPTITNQPDDVTTTTGQTVQFTVEATGDPVLTYQWRKGAAIIPGSTTETLTLTNVTGTTAGEYSVVVTNKFGSATSNVATLTVLKGAATVTVSNLLATYNGSAHPTTATTTPSGLAYTLTYSSASYPATTTAPRNAGVYAATAVINDPNYEGSGAGSVTINKAPQTITLSAALPSVVTVGANDFPLSASVSTSYAATSPLAPVFSSSDPAVASIDPLTGVIDVKAIGSVTFTVSQPGDSNHHAAESKTYTLRVVAVAPPPPVQTCGTVLLRHTPTMNGQAGIEGSVHVLLPEDMAMNGQAWISGSLLLPGTPSLRLNGNPSIAVVTDGAGAAAPASHTLTLNGQAVIGKLVRRTDPVPMPTVAAPLATGTRDVTINNSSEIPTSFASIRDLRVSGNVGNIALPAGNYRDVTFNGKNTLVLGTAGSSTVSKYEFNSLRLSGAVDVNVLGPVEITVADGVILSGNFGVASKPEWVSLRIANGGLTLNGGIIFSGFVVAPNGTVTLNGRDTLRGGLTADDLVINGQGLVDVACPSN